MVQSVVLILLLIIVFVFFRIKGRDPKKRVRSLNELTPRDFEAYVAGLFRQMGFTDIKIIGGANDHGVDITGKDKRGNSVAIQCKRWRQDKQIGPRTVRELAGAMQLHKAKRGFLVTTAQFTDSAQKQAGQTNITLIDARELARLGKN